MAADLSTTPILCTQSAVVPVVLAAGDSTRMGVPKSLLKLGDGTFLSRILEVLWSLGLTEPVVVLGKHAPLIQGNLAARGARALVNPNPDLGQLSSLQLALRHLQPCAGCLVWPVDQPGVRADVPGGLIKLFLESGSLITMPACGGKRGHPVVFSSRLFAELLAVPAGSGAKAVIRAHENDIALFHTDDRATVEDIDTPGDYARLVGA